MYSKAPKKIRKGWHDWFAWYPVPLTGERGFAWLYTVERKYYQPNRSHVVKAGLNENRYLSYMPVKKMHRRKGSDVEKTVYCTRGGVLYADATEIINNLPDDFFDKFKPQ